jgi:phage major head subunit gpT-like protein
MEFTQANLDALRVGFDMRFQTAYGEAEVWYNKIATEIPVNARTGIYGWIAQQLRARKWIGPRIAQNLAERSYSIVNEEYEATVELNRLDVKYDNLGMFQGQALPQLAVAMKKHPDILLNALIQANTALAYDGLSMFNTAHLTFNGAGTYSNDFTTAPLTAANFNAAWAAMTAYTGEDGLPLKVKPNLLVCGPLLKLTALQILNSTLIASNVPGVAVGSNPVAGVDNQLKGWADVLVIDELPGSVWYLLDVSKPIKPFIYQLGEAPIFQSLDQITDPKVFAENKLTYGSSVSDAVGISLPFLCSRNTP